MPKRKQDWSPKGPWFEDKIDGLLRDLKKSGASEAVLIADFLLELRVGGDLDRDFALAILDEIEAWAEFLRKKIELLH